MAMVLAVNDIVRIWSNLDYAFIRGLKSRCTQLSSGMCGNKLLECLNSERELIIFLKDFAFNNACARHNKKTFWKFQESFFSFQIEN